MKDKTEKLEEMEVITGQVDTPEPEDKEKKASKSKGKKNEDETEEKQIKASIPEQEFHDRLKATFKRE